VGENGNAASNGLTGGHTVCRYNRVGSSGCRSISMATVSSATASILISYSIVMSGFNSPSLPSKLSYVKFDPSQTLFSNLTASCY